MQIIIWYDAANQRWLYSAMAGGWNRCGTGSSMAICWAEAKAWMDRIDAQPMV